MIPPGVKFERILRLAFIRGMADKNWGDGLENQLVAISVINSRRKIASRAYILRSRAAPTPSKDRFLGIGVLLSFSAVEKGRRRARARA